MSSGTPHESQGSDTSTDTSPEPLKLLGYGTSSLILSKSEVPQLWQMALGLSNSLTQLWNLFMIINGVILGWLVTTQKSFGFKERLFASLLYLIFVSVNFTTLHRMYGWVGNILIAVRKVAIKLDDTEQKTIKETLSKIDIPGGKLLGYVAYVSASILVLSVIWLDYLIILFRG